MERVILEKAEAQVQKWKSEWPERVTQQSGESSGELPDRNGRRRGGGGGCATGPGEGVFPSRGEGSRRREVTADTGESEEDRRTERGGGTARTCREVRSGPVRACPAWSHLGEKTRLWRAHGWCVEGAGEGGRRVNSSPGCGGGLHKTDRQRQAETGIWMTASLRGPGKGD